MYIRTHPNVDPNMVRSMVSKIVNDRLRNIPCTMLNNITHETLETTMVDTFEWIENRNPIISGNGTFFKQHAEYLAPTVKMLEKLQANRKKKKKEMYGYQKGSVEYTNCNIGQLSIKVIMNADYGGSGTPLSPFYSCYLPPATTGSAKNITTSLICCLEFISENNNQWSKLNNVNELFDLIFTVLEDKREDRVLIKDRYSVDEVTEWLLSRTNNVSGADRRTVHLYLSTLSDDDLTKLMLSFNIRLVLRKYVSSEIGQIMSYLIDNQIDMENITKESVHRCGYGVKPPEEIADTIEKVSKIIVDNCVYPFILNDVEIRAAEMDRLIVCVTDTDSLMVQFAHYIADFQANNAGVFRDQCIVSSAFGMRLFIEHIIPRMVEDIATFCNINDKYYRDKFVFKNEFAFLSMALLAKKMYASSMFVQEGNPRNPHEIAVSGLSFKKRDAAEFLEPIMVDIYDKDILTCDQVSISNVLDKYYALRNKLLSELDHDPSYFKVMGLKDISAYDQTKVLPAQMRGAIVWNNIMTDEEMLPMDRVRVIPLSFALLKEHQNDYPQIAEILRLSLIDNQDEKNDPYICIPEHYHSIPEWIKPVIDIEYATDKLLMPFKQLLDAFDVYVADVPGGFRPARMVFI
jgi:DNA polymerase elongation subunit (family B)